MHQQLLASRAVCLVAVVVVAVSPAGPVRAAEPAFPEIRNTQDPDDRPPSPQEAADLITAPAGFRVSLFAGDPDVRQPIAMTFDDRGRLWVAECYSYEGRGYDGTYRDRVLIFDDTDGDGRFDTRKVFWDEGRNLAGLEIGFGGVWVLCAPEMKFIPDHDGDDIPDGPAQIVLDGWTLKAGHNIVNGLRWGPDGWLYGRHGILATSRAGTPGTPPHARIAINCGIWRYHPVRKAVEAVTHGTTNPWGFDYDDHGEMFFTNNVIGHLWHVVPGAHYRRMYGEDFNPYLYGLMTQCADHFHWDTGQNWTDSRNGKGVHGELGGGHSHCGGMIYLGDNWPDRFRNGMFMCNTHGRRVNHDRLVRSGAGYAGEHRPDFLFANNPWFRGVEMKYGPDGGVFLSDWTDLGECHDHDGVHRTSGRIYKVWYVGENGAGATPSRRGLTHEPSGEELVAWQLHRNDWFVRHARRVLHERAAAGEEMSGVHAELREMFISHADVTRRLRAMWALYVTGGAEAEWLRGRLRDADEHVRAWGVRLLVDLPPVPPATGEALADLARRERSGLVRLHLASAMQRLPDAVRWQVGEALARSVSRDAAGTADPGPGGSRSSTATDRNFAKMVWYGIEPLVPTDPDRAVALARASDHPLVRQFVARRLTENIRSAMEPVDVLARWLAEDTAVADRLDVLRGMAEALRGWRRAPAPPSWPAAQASLASAAEAEVRDRVRELSVVFGDGRALDELRAIAARGDAPPHERRNALRVLIENRPPDLAPLLHKLVGDRATATLAIRGLAAYDDPATPEVILRRYGGLRHEAPKQAIETLVSRPSFARALLEAVAKGRIDRRDITPFHVRQIAGFGNGGLNEKVAALWGTVRPTAAEKRSRIESYRRSLTPQRLAEADLGRGRAVFHRTCAACHRLYGEGGTVGPDITGSNRDNLDYLLENIVDPSAVVPRDFHMTLAEMEDGRVVGGALVEQTEQTLTIHTPTGPVVLDRRDVTELRRAPLSVMPDGLLEALPEDEVRDLIAYLMARSQVPMIGNGAED